MHGGFSVLPDIDHRSLRGPLHHQREAYKEGRWWEGQASWLFLFLSEPQKIVQLSCLGSVTIHEAPGEPLGLALPRGRGACLQCRRGAPRKGTDSRHWMGLHTAGSLDFSVAVADTCSWKCEGNFKLMTVVWWQWRWWWGWHAIFF